MATFSDIFDWLNQGAQGDIPGTVPGSRDNPLLQPGQEGAVVGSRPVPGSADRNSFWNPQIAPYNPPGVADDRVQDISAQQSAQRPSRITVDSDTLPNFSGVSRLLDQYHAAVTPQDYSGDVSPTILPYYNALVQMGLPPAVAKSIAAQPAMGEGEMSLDQIFNPWPYSYQGQEQEHAASKQQPLEDHMWDVYQSRQMNLPRGEGDTLGSSAGLLRLPTGEYVPDPGVGTRQQTLNQYQSQGDPSSFWWNPQPETFWGYLMGGGQ